VQQTAIFSQQMQAADALVASTIAANLPRDLPRQLPR
jgi:hypothetical protein